MILWYRRDGTPYPEGLAGMREVERDLRDLSKKIVKQEKIGRFWISTVWLGLNHAFLESKKPLIFETMVFDQRRRRLIKIGQFKRLSVGEEVDIARYSSLDDALAGHAEMVRKWNQKRKRRAHAD